MIKIENVEVYGWEAAIRGMRNPMNSWDMSDTTYWCYPTKDTGLPHYIGCNDLNLMKNLSKAGDDHGKFLRMITVTFDITAPLYWLKEFDTYKVGTVANSSSTMHKIHAKMFTPDDFSHEHLSSGNLLALGMIIDALNDARRSFLETKDKSYWWQMIQLLPSSYNQLRTVLLNYQVLKSMYHARKSHKLNEWREFCKWCETLPYFMEICVEQEADNVESEE